MRIGKGNLSLDAGVGFVARLPPGDCLPLNERVRALTNANQGYLHIPTANAATFDAPRRPRREQERAPPPPQSVAIHAPTPSQCGIGAYDREFSCCRGERRHLAPATDAPVMQHIIASADAEALDC